MKMNIQIRRYKDRLKDKLRKQKMNVNELKDGKYYY